MNEQALHRHDKLQRTRPACKPCKQAINLLSRSALKRQTFARLRPAAEDLTGSTSTCTCRLTAAVGSELLICELKPQGTSEVCATCAQPAGDEQTCMMVFGTAFFSPS